MESIIWFSKIRNSISDQARQSKQTFFSSLIHKQLQFENAWILNSFLSVFKVQNFVSLDIFEFDKVRKSYLDSVLSTSYELEPVEQWFSTGVPRDTRVP